jgi:Protein similar to CwfJ C-terminus 1
MLAVITVNTGIYTLIHQSAAIAGCRLCTESKVFKTQTMLAHSQHAYLQLVSQDSSITEDHYRIVPIKHVQSIIVCEEEVGNYCLSYTIYISLVHHCMLSSY